MTTTHSPISPFFPLTRRAPNVRARHGQRPENQCRQLPPLPSEEWVRLHLALGVSALQVERWLAAASVTLRQRYQLALTQQADSGTIGEYVLLHDPLEDDPQWQTAFEEVEEMLAFELELSEVEDSPNFCHFVWNEKARLLREEFGLEWFSPAQMNPFVRFA